MAAALSQSEIEALLSSMTAEAAAESGGGDASDTSSAASLPLGGDSPVPAYRTVTPDQIVLPLHKRRRAAAEAAIGPGRSGPQSYEHYDFRRPDKLSKEHLRSMQMLHETFANHFASSLSAYLRTQVQIDVVSVEQLPYDEYLRSISLSLLNVINVQPLSGQVLWEMSFSILYSMLDRLLGGTGAAGNVQRDLTDIERVLAENMVGLGLGDMQTAWANVNPLEFDLVSMDTASQFVQIVPGNDTVILIMLEVEMGEQRGAMSLCLPYLLIKPILPKLSTQKWLTHAAKKPTPKHAIQLADRLETTPVSCVARLGTASLSVSDLTGLTVGQVVPMHIPGEEDHREVPGAVPKGTIGTVDVLVGGQLKFRGKTGLRGDKLAVQIQDVVAPPAELIAHKEQI